MRVVPREGARDGSKDLRRAGRDKRDDGGALSAARRAAAGRGRRLAPFERAAIPGKRGWLVDVRGAAARARPLHARLPCRAPGRRRHLQHVPHLRLARVGGRLGDDLREPVGGSGGADLVRAHRHGPDRGLRPQVPVLLQGHAPRARAIGFARCRPGQDWAGRRWSRPPPPWPTRRAWRPSRSPASPPSSGYAHLRSTTTSPGSAADEGIFGLAQAYRGFVKERPGLYAATVRSYRLSHPDDPELAQAEGRAFEPVLAVLASYGLSGEEAIHAARGLRSVAHGFATLEVAGGFGIALDPEESFVRLLEAFAAGLRH